MLPVAQQHVEQDLDVDLVIRHVDAAGVVDGVGVQVAAALPVLEARPLRQAEVAAFADDPRPHRRGVDADAIVGAIADVGVLLGRRLDVGADAAVVEQVDLRGQDRADHLLAARRLVLDAEQRARLRR